MRVWQHEARHRAAAGVPSSGSPSSTTSIQWPSVDWSRYHIQVLFVDRSDTTRARLAAGLFEVCAAWNGYGRALYPWTAGLAPVARDIHWVSKLAAVAGSAAGLGISPKSFSRPTEAFELQDLDRYDLVVALDTGVLQELFAAVDEGHASEDREWYMTKVCLLTNFNHYETDAEVTRCGGTALLPSKLAVMLRPGLKESKAIVDVVSPDLSAADGTLQWDRTVNTLILATAGLVKYLIDAYPENMPHWDPVD